MNQQVLPILGELEACNIDNINIDFKNNTLALSARTSSNAVISEKIFDLEFQNISAFYFIDDTSEVSSPESNTSNSIFYYDKGIGEFATIRNVDGEYDEDNILSVSIPNFSISLESSSIFIESRKLKINGSNYKINTLY